MQAESTEAMDNLSLYNVTFQPDQGELENKFVITNTLSPTLRLQRKTKNPAAAAFSKERRYEQPLDEFEIKA